MYKKKGFTLSEVLITLGIIGVIAAFTIPTLLKNIQDLQYKNAWKKTFSVYSNAIRKMAYDNGGELGSWDFLRYNIGSYIVSAESISPTACNGDYSYMRNGGSCYFGTLVTNDGVRMVLNNYGPYGSDLTFDVNGDKGPNQAGQDIFGASYTKEGKLIPFGADGSSYNSTYICHPNSPKYNGSTDGIYAFYNGLACSAAYLGQ